MVPHRLGTNCFPILATSNSPLSSTPLNLASNSQWPSLSPRSSVARTESTTRILAPNAQHRKAPNSPAATRPRQLDRNLTLNISLAGLGRGRIIQIPLMGVMMEICLRLIINYTMVTVSWKPWQSRWTRGQRRRIRPALRLYFRDLPIEKSRGFGGLHNVPVITGFIVN